MRGFNQSQRLAKVLSHEISVPLAFDVLSRSRYTASQGRLGREERAKNVRGAFTINPDMAKSLNKKSILLVDDVLTSGATVNACAQVLKKAGAKRVSVLTLARVVRPGDG